MKISIYVSAFNLVDNKFNYKRNLTKFSKFADEVVIAVNTSKDGTLEELTEYSKKFDNVIIISTAFSYDDIGFDGKIKNAALQATTGDIKIQMDFDEYIPLSQKSKWVALSEQLLASPYDGLMVATIDLWGDKNKIRANHNVGLKFRIHKAGLHRGIWYRARVNDKINTSMSDTCELLDSNGELANCVTLYESTHLMPILVSMLNKSIFTVHEGYLNFPARVDLSRKFWKKHWDMRSGEDEKVPMHLSDLTKEPTISHNLELN